MHYVMKTAELHLCRILQFSLVRTKTRMMGLRGGKKFELHE